MHQRELLRNKNSRVFLCAGYTRGLCSHYGDRQPLINIDGDMQMGTPRPLSQMYSTHMAASTVVAHTWSVWRVVRPLCYTVTADHTSCHAHSTQTVQRCLSEDELNWERELEVLREEAVKDLAEQKQDVLARWRDQWEQDWDQECAQRRGKLEQVHLVHQFLGWAQIWGIVLCTPCGKGIVVAFASGGSSDVYGKATSPPRPAAAPMPAPTAGQLEKTGWSLTVKAVQR